MGLTRLKQSEFNPSSGWSLRKLIERAKSFFLGDDIFISYSRADSTNYAPALAKQLGERKFICFVDQYGTDINDDLPPRLIRKLLRSTSLVLIGSQNAVNSEPVRKEIDLFKTTGRPIIPIDVDGALSKSGWYQIIRGLPISKDLQPGSWMPDKSVPAKADEIVEASANLVTAKPSVLVINRIADSFKYTKRTQWQRRLLIASALLILSSIGIAVWASNTALNAVQTAKGASTEAANAKQRTIQAQVQYGQAQLAMTSANGDMFVARADTKVANESAKSAEVREKVAKINEAQATANAKEQGEIASSRQLAAHALATLDTELDTSLRSSVAAYSKRSDTAEAHSSLLKGVQRHVHLERILRLHDRSVNRMALTPDGEVLASASLGKFTFWDLRYNRQLGSFVLQLTQDIVVSPDGKRFAALAFYTDSSPSAKTETERSSLWNKPEDGPRNRMIEAIIVWEVTGSGAQRKVKFLTPPFEVHFTAGGRGNDPLVFSGDGRTIIYGGMRSVPGARNVIIGLEFLDLASRQGSFYPIHEPEEVSLTSRTDSRINALKLSPDRRTLAIAHDNSIELWDTIDKVALPEPLQLAGQEIEEKPPIGTDETKATEGPKTNGGEEGEAANLTDSVGSQPQTNWFSSLSFSPDGKILASARRSNYLILWDVTSRKMLLKPSKGVGSAVTFTSQGKSLATLNYETNNLTLWDLDLETKAARKRWSEVYTQRPLCLVSNPGAGSVVATGNADGTTTFWTAEATSQLGRTYPAAMPGYLDFNRNGNLLLALSNEGEILWTVSRKGTLSRSSLSLTAIARGTFRPKAAVSIGNDFKEVYVRDFPERSGITLPIPHLSTVFQGPAVTTDGKRLAAFEGNAVVLWDISDRHKPRRLFPLVFDPRDSGTSAVFNRYGNLLLVGYSSGRLVLWDLARGNKAKVFASAETISAGNFNRVYPIAISDDGQRVASSSETTGHIYLWDASGNNPTLLGSLNSAPPGANSVPDMPSALSFSPNRKLLISGSAAGIVVWSIDPQSWRRRANELIIGTPRVGEGVAGVVTAAQRVEMSPASEKTTENE